MNSCTWQALRSQDTKGGCSSNRESEALHGKDHMGRGRVDWLVGTDPSSLPQRKLCTPFPGEGIDGAVRADIWQIRISPAILDVYS